MITVKITENDSDRYEYITFPVNKYSFYDQLDRVGIFGEYTASLYDVSWGSYLKEIKLSDEPSIDEFNFLAKRLDKIFENEFEEIAYRSVISKYETVSIAEAINRTYGLESVPVFPCGNAKEYGAVVLENDFLEELNEIPDELYDLLDREKIGRLMQEREGGIFTDGYYVIPSSYEPQLVYDGVLPEPMDGWFFKLEVTVMDSDDPDEDMLETLTLPASMERIAELEDKFGKPASEWVWLSFSSGLGIFDSDSMRNADGVDRNGYATIYEYDANGNRTAVRYANGYTTTYDYDLLNRLVRQETLDNDGEVVVQYIYTLGAAGERLSVAELNRTVEYTYDNLYRLTGETITEGENVTAYTYSYDNVGNRILKTKNGSETEYTYNEINQLVSDSDATYEYDLNGNLVRVIGGAQSALYEYNSENKLVKATVQQGVNVVEETYTYDYAGNRTSKTTSTSDGNFELVKYLNDNSSLTNVLAELDSEGNVQAYYTIGADLISQERNGRTYTYLYDGHGSVTDT